MAAEHSISQTPIHEVHNPDIFNLMRKDFRCVVEVGSSSGALARVYRQDNPHCRYVGIEIDPAYADASARYCTEVVSGDVEKIDEPTFASFATADCWIFGDALEHLYDPWGMLKRVRQQAQPDLEVIACIPNVQFWGMQLNLNSGNFVYQDAGLMDRTHIRWFTRKTIDALFSGSGFRIVDMRCRLGQQPAPDVAAVIQQMAVASRNDPAQALSDSLTVQYVIRAVVA